jgi:hypothetical protein
MPETSELRDAADADELLVTTITYSRADRVRSFEPLAREWGLTRCGRSSAPGAPVGPLLAVISYRRRRSP